MTYRRIDRFKRQDSRFKNPESGILNQMSVIKKIIIWILTFEAKAIISKYKPFMVAVTGSVGKTSTKDAIYDVLKDQGRYVRKSHKNLNSDIGLPLTIIGVPNAWHDASGWLKNIYSGLRLAMFKGDYPDILILEVGADHPGDIKRVTRWLHPDISVITRVSRTPVHVEFFDSPEQVFEEKAALAGAVKSGGTLVVFGDDDLTMSMGDIVKDKGAKIVSYGMDEKAAVRASNAKNSLEGLSFELAFDGKSAPVAVKGVLGTGHVYSLLAAAAVGKARGLGIDVIAGALSAYSAPRGRMNLIQGINGSTVIDDTYNSSPDAAETALETLKAMECSGAKVAVLGDMMELGKYAAEEHRKIGALAARVVGRLYTVGQRSKLTADEAVKSGMPRESVESFDDANQAAEYLKAVPQSGDIILVKGSQSVRMERVVKALMAEPDKASELLVRQEKVWLDKM
ncbi:MAG: UDP-N-acetylmuramoyl-tripeptide--D-alanyl-D-alanine ligase [Patescibacteria group bacterium]|nr:UDP-N-acetylmuramoyl-tripeptide--D-alanyl-D-alanine ligase [Patescibacteria group bacterium]